MSSEETIARRLGELDFEEMSADDWENVLEEEDVRLHVRDPRGEHVLEWDDHEDRVTFRAFGNAGYDEDGTRAALEEVAFESDGLWLEFYEEVSA